MLHEGKISEMKPAGKARRHHAFYLNALSARASTSSPSRLSGEARRPVDGEITSFLVLNGGPHTGRSRLRRAEGRVRGDITYGTNTSSASNYLRDNNIDPLSKPRPREPNYAIVDEVDSILIDEARTPLIFSGLPEAAADTYYSFAKIVPRLKEGEDSEVARRSPGGPDRVG